MIGKINNIQKYSLNDGGGIRTVIFLQGCPMRCRWCSNPETQSTGFQRIFWKNKCIGCGSCINACPYRIGCTDLSSGRCKMCLKCLDACVTGALKAVAKDYSVSEIVRIVERDVMFYQQSGGGVTLSGGEPLMQWEFSAALLKELRERCIDTAIETTGFAAYDHLLAVAKYCNRILYDVKHMDSSLHKEYTGVSNQRILSNLAALSSKGFQIIIRIPLIHNVNDSIENISETADFALSHGIREIHLLPFHRLGEPKYEAIGMPVAMPDATVPEEHVNELKSMLEKRGLSICVGG